jgi:hypothetical protein
MYINFDMGDDTDMNIPRGNLEPVSSVNLDKPDLNERYFAPDGIHCLMDDTEM